MSQFAGKRKELEEQFGALINDAYSAYAASAGKHRRDFLSPPIKSVNELLQMIRGQNEKFVAFREKERKLLDVVSEILKPVEAIGGIVAGAASEVFAPSQTIFSAVLYLISAAQDVSVYYDSILDLFTQLQVRYLLVMAPLWP